MVQGVSGRHAGIIIAPRELIDAIGGYKDLNYLEDREYLQERLKSDILDF